VIKFAIPDASARGCQEDASMAKRRRFVLTTSRCSSINEHIARIASARLEADSNPVLPLWKMSVDSHQGFENNPSSPNHQRELGKTAKAN
jgi:hypothetical protein